MKLLSFFKLPKKVAFDYCDPNYMVKHILIRGFSLVFVNQPSMSADNNAAFEGCLIIWNH